jgi:hypothetical protein
MWLVEGIAHRLRLRAGERAPVDAVAQVIGGRLMRESVGPRGDRSVLVVDGTRWTSVSALLVSGPGPVGGAGATRLPIGELWTAISPTIRKACSLQVVVQRTPVADGRARWRTWMCLGVDSALCGDAIDARGGEARGVIRTALVETARVGDRAGLLGLRLDPLDATALRTCIAELLVPDSHDDRPPEPAAAAVGPPPEAPLGDPAVGPLLEDWSACAAGGMIHRSYRQDRWSGTAALAAALSDRAIAGAVGVTAAITLRYDDLGMLAVEPVIRVTASPGGTSDIDAHLARIGADTQVRWSSLDGAHLDGLRATMPLGCRA